MVVGMLVEEVKIAKSKVYKKVLTQAFAMCCWHSLGRTLEKLQSEGVLETLFKLMFENVEKMEESAAMRRVVYGLVTLVDENHLLPPVRWMMRVSL